MCVCGGGGVGTEGDVRGTRVGKFEGGEVNL